MNSPKALREIAHQQQATAYSKQLHPCPFCDVPPQFLWLSNEGTPVPTGYIKCNFCGTEIGHGAPDQVIARWNRAPGIATRKLPVYLLNRILNDPRLAYYFDPLTQSMELLLQAWSEVQGREDNLEIVRADVTARMRFERPTCADCGGKL